MKTLSPLMVKLAGKQVVIVGGGRVALRKAQGLSVTSAKITVISPTILPEILTLPNVIWHEKRFTPEDIQSAHLVYAATNDKSVNQTIGESIQDWQWFNDTSQPEHSNFYTPAVIHATDFTISISTDGKDPAKAKQLKQQLMDYFSIEDNLIT